MEMNSEIERVKKREREVKNDHLLDLDLKLRSFESKMGKRIVIAGFIIALFSFYKTVLTLTFWKSSDNKVKEVIPVSIKQQSQIRDSIS